MGTTQIYLLCKNDEVSRFIAASKQQARDSSQFREM